MPPAVVKSMTAVLQQKLPEGEDWLYELKLDFDGAIVKRP